MANVSVPTLALALLIGLGATARADTSSGSLMNKFTGTKTCLTPVGAGQVNMMPCTDARKQIWDLIVLNEKQPDRFQLKNRASPQCLDIVNDGTNNKLTIAACGNYTGQFWTQRWREGSFRLTTDFTGASKCLDVVNDGRNNKLIMAPCGNYSGQYWDMQGND